jgi:hypothetical protein
VLRGGGVGRHQGIGFRDLMMGSSIKLLRWKSWCALRLRLLGWHGVDGRAHGLVVSMTVKSGGTPALGRGLRLCDGGQRA